MARRGNKKPGFVAKAILALIVVTAVAIVWLGVTGIHKQANEPSRTSQTLPAQTDGQAPQPRPTP